MILQLSPHPTTPPRSVRSIEVEIIWSEDDLLLTYVVSGAEALVVPGWRSPARADDLWKSTCFELFVKRDGSPSYFEYNFSPSGEWAAYSFDAQRAGMTNLDVAVAPHIEDSIRYDLDLPQRQGEGSDCSTFAAEIDLDLTEVPPGPLLCGLSAVIEEAGGRKSYWALAHPPEGPPDFHHPDCFVLELPPPARP